MTTSIKTRAMLARLRFSVWAATVTDDAVSAKTASDHGAATDSGRYVKKLISAAPLRVIWSIRVSAIDFHKANTLPWEDGGSRILPTKNFLAYSAKISDLIDEFDGRVEDFIGAYPELRDEAQARLGTMFDAADFPEPHDLRKKFGMKLDIWGIPDAADFRVDIGDEHIKMIRQGIEQATSQRLKEGHADLWRRLHGAVAHMADKLRSSGSVADGRTHKSPFRDSAVDGVRELAELLPRLNVTDDPELDAMAKRVIDDLCDLDGPAFRASDKFRTKYAKTADQILEDMAGYVGAAT